MNLRQVRKKILQLKQCYKIKESRNQGFEESNLRSFARTQVPICSNKGITLIEVLISITIFSIFLLSVYFILDTGYNLFNKKLKNFKGEYKVNEFFRVLENDINKIKDSRNQGFEESNRHFFTARKFRYGKITQIKDDSFVIGNKIEYKIEENAISRTGDREQVFDFEPYVVQSIEFQYLDSNCKGIKEIKFLRFLKVIINLDSKTKERLFLIRLSIF